MATSKRVAKVDERQQMIVAAIADRPSYLPAITEDSAINQIEQRGPLLPTLSLNNERFTLLENGAVIHKFDGDDLAMWFLHIFYTPQRRAFEGEWDEDNPEDPICMSDTNIIPLKEIDKPESDKCADCWRSQDDTARSDKCSYFRNAIVLLEYENSAGEEVQVLAKLRLNGGTLYGEENRSAGELNGESLVRMFKESLRAELWYHPVVAFFDTDSKGARNKLLFEVIIADYPDEELAKHIMACNNDNDYIDMTRQRVFNRDNDGESDDEGGKASQRETASPGKTSARGKASAKKKSVSSRRSTKSDKAEDDSSGSDAPTRSRNSGASKSKRAGKANAKGGAEQSDGEQGGGEGSVESSDTGDANPLEDPAVTSLIGNVDLP